MTLNLALFLLEKGKKHLQQNSVLEEKCYSYSYTRLVIGNGCLYNSHVRLIISKLLLCLYMSFETLSDTQTLEILPCITYKNKEFYGIRSSFN